ncbi:hypothetical protein E4U45_003644 [Claviceps purpurea]|nr:hypothetical protein E4U45_003644 [Claviceps purpurea]
MTGGSEWATAHGKAKALVAKISLLERVSLTGGAFSKTGYSGTIAPIPRLNFSGMCLSDSGNGLRNMIFWNKALTRKRGAAMGGEFGRKGVNVFLGPVVGPAGRIVRGGRNWEGFSTDPYLSSCLAARTIEGVQSEGVQHCRVVSRYDFPTVSPFLFVEMYSAVRFQDVKMYLADMTPDGIQHFIANEQELNRRPVLGAEAVSSNDPNLDDRTMHEVYLIGPGVAAALAGMDVAMPSPAELWGKYLVEAVKNGFVPESRVTDMSHGHKVTDTKFSNPGFGMPHSMIAFWNPTNRSKAEIGKTGPRYYISGAMEGHVLVKNTKGALPLRSPRSISVFGYSARSADVLAPSADEVSLNMWRYGQTSISVGQAVEGLLGNAQPAATKGTLMGGGGSGGSTPAVFVSPYDALSVRAAQDDMALYHDFSSPTPESRRNAQQRRLPRVRQRLGQRGHRPAGPLRYLHRHAGQESGKPVQ